MEFIPSSQNNMFKKVRLLWADDEIELLKSHILFLEKKNFDVSPVSSGEEAIHICSQKKFDLILLDQMMSGIDGIETLKKIKEINPSIPIIMITKNEDEWMMNEAIASKISDYLIKPINPNQILSTCKRILSAQKIQEDKIITDFLGVHKDLYDKITNLENISQWMEIIDEVINWEIILDKVQNQLIEYYLNEIKRKLNSTFTSFFEKKYKNLLLEEKFFPHKFLDNEIKPLINNGEKVALIVLDCLRYDQAKLLANDLYEYFDVQISTSFSLIPTTTEFSRNSIFSGLLPHQIKEYFPHEWKHMKSDSSKLNSYEDIFLKSYCKRNFDKKISIFYDKVMNLNYGLRLNEKIKNYKNIDLISVVVNFIDILGHASADSSAVREIISNDKSYRYEVRNWFLNSWLYDTIMQFKSDNRKIIITSDHGNTLIKKPLMIKAERQTSSGLRYKSGRNLNVSPKYGLNIKNPDDYFLPKSSQNQNYIIAKSNYYFIYPNDFNYFKKTFENTYQHGGISIDEIVLPIIKLT